jgi:hypothetical protein
VSGQLRSRPRTDRPTRELVALRVMAALVFGACLLLAMNVYWVAPLVSR